MPSEAMSEPEKRGYKYLESQLAALRAQLEGAEGKLKQCRYSCESAINRIHHGDYKGARHELEYALRGAGGGP